MYGILFWTIFCEKWFQNFVLNKLYFFLGKNGGNAAAQYVVDRSSVSQKSSGHTLRMSPDAYVYLCLCILFEKE